MNEEKKTLGLDAFEMPNAPKTNNGPMIDSAMPTIDNYNVNTPIAPVIDNAMPSMNAPTVDTPIAPTVDNYAMPLTNPAYEMPTIDNAMSSMNAPTIDNVAPIVDTPVMETYNAPTVDTPIAPTMDNYAMPSTNPTYEMPTIDNAMSSMNTPTIDNVAPVVNTPVMETYNAPVIDNNMQGINNQAIENNTIDNFTTNNTQVSDSYINQVPNGNPTVDSFDYNFDFESQINNNINYSNAVPPVAPVAHVNIEPEPVAPVSPVPIIMPENNINTNITSGDSSNEGIVSGPGNQMSNTFNSYINDNDTTNNTLKTANIVKETQTTKESKGGLIFLFIIFFIIALFIILLPKLM